MTNRQPGKPPNSVTVWWMAIRPKTLTAALIPVVIGAAYASRTAVIDIPILLFILGSALCIQIATNLANDYSDYKSGADTHERLGPTRVTQAGLIAPERVKRGAIVVFTTAVIFGLPLIYRGGWPILLIGVIGIVCGWAYTGGPYPLGYNGLGELFVMIFFGFAAVMGTSYLFMRTWTAEGALLGSCPGMLASALLAVNNVRDIETDRRAGKRTLAARFGRSFGRFETALLLLLPYGAPFILLTVFGYSYWILLPLASLPFVIRPLRSVLTKTDGPSLNIALADTAKLNLIFGALLAIGLVI